MLKCFSSPRRATVAAKNTFKRIVIYSSYLVDKLAWFDKVV